MTLAPSGGALHRATALTPMEPPVKPRSGPPSTVTVMAAS